MRFSITALLRLVLLLGLGSTLLAIEVARAAPKGLHARFPRKPRVVGLAGLAFPGADESTRFLDPETGAIQRLPLPAGERLDNAICSPWQDETGVSHVVGRWRKDEGSEGGEVMTDIGLACYTYPQGEEVGRISCEVLPQGGACWYPGTSDRVLFAAADGSLQHVTFETSARQRAHAAGDTGVPVRLRWDAPRPGAGAVMVRHPFWPSAPGFEHTVLVSLRYLVPQPAVDGYSTAQLWWLRLDGRGTSIVAAGRLTQPAAAPCDESAPSLAATPEGLALAYMTRSVGRLEWKLHLAPVRLDRETGNPRAESARAVVIADDCADVPAGFSADGRRVYAVLHPRGAATRVERFVVPHDLAAR